MSLLFDLMLCSACVAQSEVFSLLLGALVRLSLDVDYKLANKYTVNNLSHFLWLFVSSGCYFRTWASASEELAVLWGGSEKLQVNEIFFRN